MIFNENCKIKSSIIPYGLVSFLLLIITFFINRYFFFQMKILKERNRSIFKTHKLLKKYAFFGLNFSMLKQLKIDQKELSENKLKQITLLTEKDNIVDDDLALVLYDNKYWRADEIDFGSDLYLADIEESKNITKTSIVNTNQSNTHTALIPELFIENKDNLLIADKSWLFAKTIFDVYQKLSKNIYNKVLLKRDLYDLDYMINYWKINIDKSSQAIACLFVLKNIDNFFSFSGQNSTKINQKLIVEITEKLDEFNTASKHLKNIFRDVLETSNNKYNLEKIINKITSKNDFRNQLMNKLYESTSLAGSSLIYKRSFKNINEKKSFEVNNLKYQINNKLYENLIQLFDSNTNEIDIRKYLLYSIFLEVNNE